MSLQKIGGGYYYVEGRNGLPGRSFPKLREAQRYDQELERAACPPPKTTTQLLAELYSDLVRWRDAGGDVRELRYVFETMDQISAEEVAAACDTAERYATALRDLLEGAEQQSQSHVDVAAKCRAALAK